MSAQMTRSEANAIKKTRHGEPGGLEITRQITGQLPQNFG